MITTDFLIKSLIVVLIPGTGVVAPGAESPLLQMLVLSGVFMAMTFAVFVVYGVLANSFRRAVIDSRQVQSWLQRSFAAAFAALGINLAFSER